MTIFGLSHKLKTTAAVLESPNQPLRVCELDIPLLNSGQVLVKMHWSGLCRSQLMEVQGLRGKDPYLPHLLGHEGYGQVIEIGPSVKKVKPDDKVVVTWIRGQGIQGGGSVFLDRNRKINAGPVATFATIAVISENCCVKVDDGISGDAASLLGCAIPTGAGIVMNEMKPRTNSSILILGAGGIGLAAIAGALISKCNPIVAVDLSEENLKLAKIFGATHTYKSSDFFENNISSKLTDGKGFDFAVEAAGSKFTIESAFNSVRDAGGLCIFASHPPEGQLISLEPHSLIRGKKIQGSWGGACDPDKDIPLFTDLHGQGKLPLENLISHRFSLDEINDAFEILERGNCGRVLLNLSNN